MFVNKLFVTVSRHNGVQRAAFCGSANAILPKNFESCILYKNTYIPPTISYKRQILYFSTQSDENKSQGNGAQTSPSPKDSNTLTHGQKLKKAVAEYGTTVIVFHVTISLISLGSCYLLVSSGLDVNQILINIGLDEWVKGKGMLVSNAGTFAVAYAVHKVFAPVRIGITLTSVPFIVRYLRHKGILKK